MGSPSPRKIYLIDGTSYLFRAFYAIRRLTGPGGVPTNATFGFTQMLRKLLQTERPQHVAVAYDRPEPTHRHELFLRYKANRQAPPEDLILQIPDVKNVCRALGVTTVELPGYEADDLIGTLSRRAAADGFEVMIVGSDKDLLQLVDDSTRILHPSSGEVLDAEGVRKRFGVTPRQVVEVLALMGDASDNIPGVPGIGEKGARELIARYGDLEACLLHAGEIERKSYRENLLASQDQARLSRDLARIHLDAPVTWDPALFARREPSREEMRRVFQELGFSRLLEENGPEAAPAEKSKVQHSGGSGEVRIIRDAGALRALAEAPSDRGRLAFVPRFSSQEPMRATLAGLTLASEPGRSIHIPTVHQESSSATSLTENELLEALKPFWTDAGVRKIAADLKAFEVFLLRHSMTLSGTKLDTTVAAYLLEPERLDYSVFGLASAYLGWPSHPIAFKPRAGRSPAPDERSVEEAAEEAAWQCQALLALEDVLSQRMGEADLGHLYRDVEVPLLSILA
ncbi:MAG TPA: 5'-3' exonuclease H3TH domain-containing protein, partial [Candidatus Polarisedimenticolia bacterium]|nr:5'-3' exonuclease H3TH domain-containing protein [Candidatus Polarisedimenticolia bacterium]